MTPKPDARIIPTQDEFDSWTLHPVTKFVAASYAISAKACWDQWTELLGSKLTPEALDAERHRLSIQQETYRAFLETEFLDYLKSVDPEAWDRVAPKDAKPRFVPANAKRAYG